MIQEQPVSRKPELDREILKTIKHQKKVAEAIRCLKNTTRVFKKSIRYKYRQAMSAQARNSEKSKIQICLQPSATEPNQADLSDSHRPSINT